jgi:hypothetical protein
MGRAILLLVNMVCLFNFFFTLAQFVPLRVSYWKCAFSLPFIVAVFFLKDQALKTANQDLAIMIGLTAACVMFAFTLWAYKGPLWKRLAVVAYLLMSEVLCEFLATAFLSVLWNRPFAVDYASVNTIYASLVMGFLILIFYGLSGWPGCSNSGVCGIGVMLRFGHLE